MTLKLQDLNFEIQRKVGDHMVPSWPSMRLFTRGSKRVAVLPFILLVEIGQVLGRSAANVSSLVAHGFC